MGSALTCVSRARKTAWGGNPDSVEVPNLPLLRPNCRILEASELPLLRRFPQILGGHREPLLPPWSPKGRPAARGGYSGPGGPTPGRGHAFACVRNAVTRSIHPGDCAVKLFLEKEVAGALPYQARRICGDTPL